MGNAVHLQCEKDLSNSKYIEIPTEMSQTGNSLSNSYIKNNFLLHKSFQNFFLRKNEKINNCHFEIIPLKQKEKTQINILNCGNDESINDNKNELKEKKEIEKENKKEEKELDLSINKSRINSIILNSESKNSFIFDKCKLDTIIFVKNINNLKKNTLKIRPSYGDIDLHQKINNQKFKKVQFNKEEINVNEENPEETINPQCNPLNQNLKLKRSSIHSIFSNIENTIISSYPKGYYLYKHLNYKYYGKTDIKNNKIGFGIIKYEDNSRIEGIFKNNKINGYAKFIDTQSSFLGYYKDSNPKGFGLYMKDNVTTIGDSWTKNHLNDIGIQIFGINDFYQGNFIKSIKQGLGIYYWNDGTICFGEWKDDKINGYGVIKYSNKNIYLGEFKDNIIEGWGEFLWSDNKYYCGQYKNGVKYGFGIYVSDFKKFDVYIGFWEYGKANGIGIKINDNDMFVCIWKEGKKLNYIKIWEIGDYLKPNQLKFGKFLLKDIKFFKEYIKKLYKNDIINEMI